MKRSMAMVDINFYTSGSNESSRGADAFVDFFAAKETDKVLYVSKDGPLELNDSITLVSFPKFCNDLKVETYDMLLFDHVLGYKKLSKDILLRIREMIKEHGTLIVVDKFQDNVRRSGLGWLLNQFRSFISRRAHATEFVEDLKEHFEVVLHIEGNFAGDRHIIHMRKTCS